jgi:hypothetical protein
MVNKLGAHGTQRALATTGRIAGSPYLLLLHISASKGTKDLMPHPGFIRHWSAATEPFFSVVKPMPHCRAEEKQKQNSNNISNTAWQAVDED